MKITKPTKREVFQELRESGCCWLGGSGCNCYSRQLSQCYAEAEKRLTKKTITFEEIQQSQKKHEETWNQINNILNELWGE